MRVFVTGATGWVGSAVVQELLGAGHQVLGMTRSDAGAAALRAAGAEVHYANLEDPDSLKKGAVQAEGVIHCAFSHDFSKFEQNGRDEQRAIAALGEVLEGTGHPLVATSGIGFIQTGHPATEADSRDPGSKIPRDPESVVNGLAARGVAATFIRLPPSVHGRGETHGFIPMTIGIAREKGVSAYVGDGQHKWSAVHRLDAARLYRLALERNAEGGPFHAVDDEGVPVKQIAELIGRRLGVPVVSKTPEEAAEHFGWFGMFAGMNAPATSARTRERLGWTAEQAGLLVDIDDAAYFGE